MKRFLLTAVSFFFCQQLFAQVAISNPASNPDPSAMLDIKSTTKGFLMPRVLLRTNVASPATGLMVYETTSNAVWVYNGTAWVQLGSGGGGASQWLVNGTHIYNGNTGNVGIGTTAPVSRLHLAGDMLMDGTNPIVQLQQSGVDKGFIQLSGDNLRMGTNSSNNSGRLVMRMNGSDRITVDSTGNMQIVGSQDAELNTHGYLMLGNLNGTNLIFDNNEMMARNNGAPADLVMQNDGGSVGIGVASPVERVEVAGNMKLKGGATFLKMEVSQAGSGGPIVSQRQLAGIQFLREGTTSNLGRMEYVDTVNLANFIRFYAGSTISNTLTVNTNDFVGVGTSDPQVRMQVVGAGEIFRLHSVTDPLMQFTTGLVGSGTKKGFLDINGNDFRIGTNSGNDAGKFIVRVNGGDVVNITPAQNIGIGTSAPEGKLHVAGKIVADAGGEAIKLDGTNPSLNFYYNGGAAVKSFMTQLSDELYLGVNGRLHLDATQGLSIGDVVNGGNNYKLAVAGNVVCEELKVKLRNNWPDYVFHKSYQLLPLAELKNFIRENKRLPNIPSAATIEKEGINVGDMQKRMMEKIEELTLYVLELQAQIDALKKSSRHSKK